MWCLRYFAPNLTVPGQYNTMVSIPAFPRDCATLSCPLLWLCSDAGAQPAARKGRFVRDTCCVVWLQIQGESWRVNSGSTKLVRVD